MFEKLLHIIPLQRTFQVLGICFSSEGTVIFQLLIVYRKKDEFSIGKCMEFTDLDAVYKEIQTKHPLFLHFSGAGILNKQLEYTANYRQKVLFKANPDDFYFYELQQAKTIFVSFCRKKIIDEYISIFQTKNYHILDIAIGPFVLYALRTFLNGTVCTNSSKLILSKQGIVDFESMVSHPVNETYTIDDLSFTHKDILLFAMVIQHHVKEEALEVEMPFLKEHKTAYSYYSATKTIGIIGLVSLLIAILVGHFLLQHYQTAITEKQALISEVTEASNKVAFLQQQKKDKETIIAISGLFQTKFSTQYVYEIGNSLHKNIQLSSINITPLTKKIRDDKEVTFFKKQIHIKGITTNDSDFNNWIASLNEKNWVQEISIESYTEDRTRKKSFLIHLHI